MVGAAVAARLSGMDVGIMFGGSSGLLRFAFAVRSVLLRLSDFLEIDTEMVLQRAGVLQLSHVVVYVCPFSRTSACCVLRGWQRTSALLRACLMRFVFAVASLGKRTTVSGAR